MLSLYSRDADSVRAAAEAGAFGDAWRSHDDVIDRLALPFHVVTSIPVPEIVRKVRKIAAAVAGSKRRELCLSFV